MIEFAAPTAGCRALAQFAVVFQLLSPPPPVQVAFVVVAAKSVPLVRIKPRTAAMNTPRLRSELERVFNVGSRDASRVAPDISRWCSRCQYKILIKTGTSDG